jgi:hypothetical protein
LKCRTLQRDENESEIAEMVDCPGGERYQQEWRIRQVRRRGEMDRRADRANSLRLIGGMLSGILLGRRRLRRRQVGNGGAASKPFEMEVSERKGKLQRHRRKREPSAPSPIGTNLAHQQHAPIPASLVYRGTNRGQCPQSKNAGAEHELPKLLPECDTALTLSGGITIGVVHMASQYRSATRSVSLTAILINVAIEAIFWFCRFAQRGAYVDVDEPHSSPSLFVLPATNSRAHLCGSRRHRHCADRERRS